MNVQRAPDVEKLIKNVLRRVSFAYIDHSRVIGVRSFGATSRARARIWSFPKIWQLALDTPAHYVVEVLSQHFDSLPVDDKIRVIIHELMHIPKNFSGALVPHRGLHKKINHKTVENLFLLYKQSKE